MGRGAMETTLGSLLMHTAETFPEKPALVCDQEKLTYRELDKSVDSFVHFMTNLGIGKGTKIALLLKDSIAYVKCLFAANRIGAISVPINTRLKTQEIISLLKQSESHVLIYGNAFSPIVHKFRDSTAIRHYHNILEFLETDRRGDFIEESAPDPSPSTRGTDHVATLLFTSGTTSARPKAAVLTNHNHIRVVETLKIDYGIATEDILLTATPLFHTSGLHRCIGAVALGCTHILMPKFDPRQFLHLVETEHVSYTFLVPTMFAMIEKELSAKEFDTSSLRLLFTGAARAHPDILDRMRAFFPEAEICMSYGCTECFTVSIIRAADLRKKWGSIGTSVSNAQLRLCDDSGSEVLKGETGEVWVKGPNVAKCYYRDIEATQEAFTMGWFKTGDLGKSDDEGFIYLVDRKKDIIISGAENISSMEVEDVLYSNEKVLEAAVIGVPDDLWGESVRALVVKKPQTDLTEEEVIDFCDKRLARYKRPKSVVFLDCLPKNASNKILKRELKERFGRQKDEAEMR